MLCLSVIHITLLALVGMEDMNQDVIWNFQIPRIYNVFVTNNNRDDNSPGWRFISIFDVLIPLIVILIKS